MAAIQKGLDGRGYVMVHNEFRYHRNRTNKATIQWRCWREDCRATLLTNFFDVRSNAQNIRILKVCMNYLLQLKYRIILLFANFLMT